MSLSEPKFRSIIINRNTELRNNADNSTFIPIQRTSAAIAAGIPTVRAIADSGLLWLHPSAVSPKANNVAVCRSTCPFNSTSNSWCRSTISCNNHPGVWTLLTKTWIKVQTKIYKILNITKQSLVPFPQAHMWASPPFVYRALQICFYKIWVLAPAHQGPATC